MKPVVMKYLGNIPEINIVTTLLKLLTLLLKNGITRRIIMISDVLLIQTRIVWMRTPPVSFNLYGTEVQRYVLQFQVNMLLQGFVVNQGTFLETLEIMCFPLVDVKIVLSLRRCLRMELVKNVG